MLSDTKNRGSKGQKQRWNKRSLAQWEREEEVQEETGVISRMQFGMKKVGVKRTGEWEWM